MAKVVQLDTHSAQVLLQMQCWSCITFDIMLMFALCDNIKGALARACKLVHMSNRDADANSFQNPVVACMLCLYLAKVKH